MPPVWIGLTVAFASAVVTNTAYSLEHDAAAALAGRVRRRDRGLADVRSGAAAGAAVALGRQQAPQADQPAPRADSTGKGTVERSDPYSPPTRS
jgi:hypothetical protein